MKLIFDATFGDAWVTHLRGFFQNHRSPRPQIQHVFDIFGEEDKDDPIWIPKLARLNCVVVSADRGTHSRLPERLPKICQDQGITHILLSATMHDRAGKFERARAIIVLWHEIVAASKDTGGSRYQIRAIDGSHRRFALKKLA